MLSPIYIYTTAIISLYNSDSVLYEVRAATKERVKNWNITRDYSRLSFTLKIYRNFVVCVCVCVLSRRQARHLKCAKFLLKLRIQNMKTTYTQLNSYSTFNLSSRNKRFFLDLLSCNFLFPSDIPSFPYQSSFPFVSS
jgi:hypothetical protein